MIAWARGMVENAFPTRYRERESRSGRMGYEDMVRKKVAGMGDSIDQQTHTKQVEEAFSTLPVTTSTRSPSMTHLAST